MQLYDSQFRADDPTHTVRTAPLRPDRAATPVIAVLRPAYSPVWVTARRLNAPDCLPDGAQVRSPAVWRVVARGIPSPFAPTPSARRDCDAHSSISVGVQNTPIIHEQMPPPSPTLDPPHHPRSDPPGGTRSHTRSGLPAGFTLAQQIPRGAQRRTRIDFPVASTDGPLTDPERTTVPSPRPVFRIVNVACICRPGP